MDELYLPNYAALRKVSGTPSRRGEKVYAAPVLISCRIDASVKVIKKANGETAVTSAVVYTNAEITEGDLLNDLDVLEVIKLQDAFGGEEGYKAVI